MGSTLSYTCTGPNQYLVTLKAYRDCGGITMPPSFSVAYNGCGSSGSVTVALQSSSDISPLCPTLTSICSGGSYPFGLEEHIYTGTVTVPANCASVIFSTSSCCRNGSITNISIPGSIGFYTSSFLNNNLTTCNSSPTFASEPALYTCLNQSVVFQQLATDSDGDSLVYSLVNCLQSPATSVPYAPGFSGVNPLTTPVTIDPNTGDLSFTATAIQVASVSVLVEEYRAGIKVGEIVRDMQFTILNCSNTLPQLSGINGASGIYSVNTCEGAPICFNINATDINAVDNLSMFYSGNIPGATFTQTGTGNNRVGTFCWTPPIGSAGTYVFSLGVFDDACPIIGQNSRSYIVNVNSNPNTPISVSADVGICSGSTTTLLATNVTPNISWSPSLALSTTSGTSTNASPTSTTTYTATAIYPDGCSSSDDVTVTVNPDPVANISPSSASVCPGGNITLTGTTNSTGMTFQWFNPSMGGLGSGTVSGTSSSIVVSVPAASGTYNYTLRITNPSTGCSSDAIVPLSVGAPPTLASCINIYVTPTGSSAAAGTQANPTNLVEALSRSACQGAVIKMAIGTYNFNNAINLQSFVTIEGGFDQFFGWRKTSQPGATTINRTTASPEGSTNAQRLVAFYGNSATGFRLQDITVRTSAANQPGMSTYGLHLTSCSDYDIVRCQIQPGNAAAGRNGTNGTNGNIGRNGGRGSAGDGNDYDDSGGGGGGGGGGGTTVGNAGTNASGNYNSANNCTIAGGNGGGGGATAGNGGNGRGDSNGCGCCNAGSQGYTGGSSSNSRSGGGGGGGANGGCEDENGGRGGNGGGVLSVYGSNLGGGNGGNDGGNGGGYPGSNGTAGSNGTLGSNGGLGSNGSHVGGFWSPGSQGGSGSDGSGGSGGAGGGGGGGQDCFFCSDGCGSGGGGGGGGGQGGQGGTGGRGGGSSYGVYLFSNGANGIINQSFVDAGNAGGGGTPGTGGTGGAGGLGGSGSPYTGGGEVGAGGNGGRGGNGGLGRSGGAGRAGQTIDVYRVSGAFLTTQVTTFNLAAQTTITASNVNCTNTNVNYTTTSASTWDFDRVTNYATPATAGSSSNTNTQYSQIARYTLSRGAHIYEGFHNISFDGSLAPEITTNADSIGVDTFQLCQGDFATFSSVYSGLTYIWNFNGAITNPGTTVQNTPSIQFNTPGFYTITLRTTSDCCGLSPTKTIYLYVDALPTVTGSGAGAICEGENRTLTLTGLAVSDSVIWTPTTNIVSSTTNTITVSPSTTTTYTASIYTKTIASGVTRLSCPISRPLTVTVSPIPTIALTLTQPNCGNNGQIVANITSGGGLYNFSWSNGVFSFNSTSSTNGSIGVGSYSVTATNTITGCSVTDTVFLFPAPGSPIVSVQNTTPATCGLNNGTANVLASGGTGPYTYTWSTGGTGTSRTNLAAATYCVTATDNLGCPTTICFDITTPDTLKVSLLSSSNLICASDSNGTAKVEATGGQPIYTYLWSNGETGDSASSLPVGTSYVIVSDSSGCTDSLSFVLLATGPSTSSTQTITVCDSLISPSGKIWRTAGTYFDTIPNSTGCDSLLTITVSISPVINTIDSITACDSLTWINGITYYANNTAAKDTLSSIQGCDSIVSLSLIINNTSSSTQTVTVCDSLLSPSGKTWNTTGTYLDTIMNASGCDSLITFNLTVNFTSSSTQTLTVCDSLISPSGKIWSTSNTYLDTILNATGCDSLMTFNLTVNYTTSSTQTLTVCDSLVSPSGKIWSTTGNYFDTILKANGCDSLLTFNLTINTTSSSTQTLIVCDSLISPSGKTWNTTGNYLDTIMNAGGCDSLMTFNLTVNFTSSSTQTITVCDSLISPSGKIWSTTGTYLDTISNSSGCDSLLTINLTVSSTINSIDSVLVCDSLIWIDGVTYYTNNNTAKDTLPSYQGCDSIITLNLTVNYTTSSTQATTICDSMISPSGKIWSTSGIYLDTITNSSGCDSLMTFNLIVNNTSSSTQTLTVCDSLLSPSGKTWNSTGTYLDTILNAAGCDSLMTFNLTVNFNSSSTQTITVCDSFVSPSGKTWNNSGMYLDTILNTSGCDSLMTFNLTVNYTISITLTDTSCDQFLWRSNNLTSSGTYYDTATTGFCDSIFTLNLTLFNSVDNWQSFIGCDSLLLPNGNTVFFSGTYRDTFSTVNGCDSIHRYQVTMRSTIITNVINSSCDSFTSPNGQVWTTSGIYADTFNTAGVCDSLVIYNLTINYTTSSIQNLTVCDSLISPSGKFWNSSGIYLDTITSNSGCDSLMTFNLTVNYTSTSSISLTVCDSLFSPSGKIWRSNGVYLDTISNVSGCDSLMTFNLTLSNYAQIPSTLNACDSISWRGSWYSSTGIYNDSVIVPGCDTVFILNLTINNSSSSAQTITVCDSLVSPTGKTWNTTGTYSDTIANAIGCDSLMTFNLTVNYTTSSSQTITVCDSIVSPSGKTWNTTGIYLDTLVKPNGCDSLMTFNLTVNYTSSSSQMISVCDSFVSPSGKIWTATGNYLDTILNASGCDSLLSINLTIAPIARIPLTITICDSVVWRGVTYTTTGNYSDTLLVAGCDTIFDLSLTVNYTTTSSQTLTVCDSLLSPSGKTWNTTGTYFDTILNSTGCDSLMTFNLTINYTTSSTQFLTVCDSLLSPSGKTWNTTGTYLDTITKTDGCDSLITFNLTVNSTTNSSQSITTCDSLLSPSGKIWRTSGIYLDTILNSNGCDSLMTFNLIINFTTSSTQTLSVCDSLLSPSGKTWNTTGIYLDTILNSSGCDSLMTFNLTINYTTSSTQTLTVCDSLLSPSGKIWSTTGTYLDTITKTDGCDSLMTFNLTVNSTTNSSQSITTCDSLLSPSGKIWRTSGIYLDTILNSIGCDSLMTFNLTISGFIPITTSVTACDSLTWRGVTYTSSGTYNDTVLIPGCDTIYTLSLVINNSSTSIINPISCGPYSSPSGKSYSTSGNYLDTISNTIGCDSIITINLIVDTVSYISVLASGCDSFQLPGGTIVYTSGAYNDTLTNISGCDSIITTNLFLSPSYNQSNTFNLCAGQTVTVGANIYGSTGIYRDTLATAFGCDSIIETNLTINPLVLGTITFSSNLCQNDLPATFTATPIGGRWIGTGIDTITGVFSPAIAGVGIHTIVYIPNGPCPLPDTVQVNVFSVPVINFDETDELCDQANGEIDVTITGGTPAYIYNWSNGDSTLNISNLKEGSYSLIVSDANNCSNSDNTSLINIIDPDCEFGIYVPNVFSPDGNQENDLFYVQGSGIETVKLVIFNRYGNKVFESNAIGGGWDGTYKGSPVNPDVFVYYVEGTFVNGEEFEKKGTITLIRR